MSAQPSTYKDRVRISSFLYEPDFNLNGYNFMEQTNLNELKNMHLRCELGRRGSSERFVGTALRRGLDTD